MRTLLLVLVSGALGALFVIACGDDTTPRADAADAAACDCPKAEPPITADRVTTHTASAEIPADSADSVFVGCKEDEEVRIGGGCSVDVPGGMILRKAEPTRNGFDCDYQNTLGSAKMATVHVICLKLTP